MSKIPLWFQLPIVVASAFLFAQPSQSAELSEEVVLTLPEALELAVRRSFALRLSQLNQEDAKEQVHTTFSAALPQLNGTASYNRTIEAADPFAGSNAGASFGGLGALPWLQFNELARTDDNPNTSPISLGEFESRQLAAQQAAGSPSSSSNPFLVENGLFFGLSLSQVLFDGAVFNSIRGAKANEKASQQGLEAERLRVISEVSQAFYNALLQKEQLTVLKQSVERAQSNLKDVKSRVELGDLPELQQLTAEVELANRRTDELRAEAEMRNLYDRLRGLVALPRHQKLTVKGKLVFSAQVLPSEQEAVPEALNRRPDLAQAQSLVRVAELATSSAKSQLLPRLLLSANVSANGRIPDNRSSLVADPTEEDPFRLRQVDSGFFDEAYWFPVVDVGVRLEWNIFNGFGNYSRIRRERIAKKRAAVTVEQTQLQVQIDVEQSLRALKIAQEQVETQESVKELAQRNYEQTQLEIQAGAATQFDLRQASQQLDESRLNYLQATHDYKVAWVQYQVAMGIVPSEANDGSHSGKETIQ